MPEMDVVTTEPADKALETNCIDEANKSIQCITALSLVYVTKPLIT